MMKNKILSAVFLMLMTFIFEAQGGSLQFNQVLTYNGTITANVTSGPVSGSIYTCPTGKVWKIECKTRTPNQVTGSMGSYGILAFYLNGTSSQDSYANGIETAPFWLKSGDNIYFRFSNDFGNSLVASYI
jgi:hypothetical protein